MAAIKRDLSYRMKRGHAEHVHGVEGRHVAFLDVLVGTEKLQHAAPLRAPYRREVEHIGGEPLMTAGLVVMNAEEVAGPIERGLCIGPLYSLQPGELAQERQHRTRIQEGDDFGEEMRRIGIRLAVARQAMIVEEILETVRRALPSSEYKLVALLLRDIVEIEKIVAIVEGQRPLGLLRQAAIDA